MKNLLLTCFFFLSVFSLHAQLSEEDLQGKWKLSTYATKDITIDVATGKVTVDKASKQVLGTKAANEVKKDGEKLAPKLKAEYLEIQKGKFTLFMDKALKKGSYTLTTDKKNNPVVNASFSDGTTSTAVPLIVTDGKIILKPLDTDKTYTYEKEI